MSPRNFQLNPLLLFVYLPKFKIICINAFSKQNVAYIMQNIKIFISEFDKFEGLVEEMRKHFANI